MENPNFNQGLYQVTVQALTENGVPQQLAEHASIVIATDDPLAPNLGKSQEDQDAVN